MPQKEFNFEDAIANCDSPKLRNYLDAKINNKYRSTDNQFYQTMVSTLRSKSKKKSNFVPENNFGRNSSALSPNNIMSPKIVASVSERTKFDDQSIV